MCAAVTVEDPPEVAPYFPETSCYCLPQEEISEDIQIGIGCAEWDNDGVWCYVNRDCNVFNIPSIHPGY